MTATIAGRYEIETLLGSGGYGEVWQACDVVLDRRVAVKLVPAPTAEKRADVLREIGILRRLHVAGVARFLDEGVDGDRLFLVMDLVAGRAFPGCARPCRWEELAPAAALLLDTMARVHAAGVVHCDLKPANVLVRDDGGVVVLDFGVARTALQQALKEPSPRAGTLRYMAPELFAPGAQATARSDLFALGYMLYEALAGEDPYDDEPVSAQAFIRQRREVPTVPLLDRAPGVPVPVARCIDSMLERSPQLRPRSAAEARELLLGASSPSSTLRAAPALPARPTLDDVMRLVEGPDRLHHLVTDAARLLHARGEGDGARIVALGEEWARSGLARWNPAGRLVVDREALDLLEDPFDATLQGLLDALDAGAGADDVRRFVDRALSRARARAQQGRLGAAETILLESVRGLRSAKAGGDAVREGERALLLLWVEVASAEGTPRALGRVRHEVCRSRLDADLRRALETLLLAAVTVGSDNPRAWELAGGLAPFEDVAIERLRHDVRVRAARGLSLPREMETVEEAVSWAAGRGDPRVRAAAAMWRSRLDYRRGAFERSALAAEEAAKVETWATDRLGATWYAAWSWLDVFELECARDLAREAQALAEGLRHIAHEARASLVLRMASYRLGELTAADTEWVELVAALGVAPLEASTAMTEAAVAWRAGDRPTALALAARAEERWRSMQHDHPADLARCLALACGDGARSPREARALSERASRCDVPGLGIQSLALLAESGALPQGVLCERALEQALKVPEAWWPICADVLSVREALRMLGLDDQLC